MYFVCITNFVKKFTMISLVNNMENKEEYVIVEFIETAEIATILRSWLRESKQGETECWWPEKNVRRFLVNKEPSKASWEIWKIRISSCGRLYTYYINTFCRISNLFVIDYTY